MARAGLLDAAEAPPGTPYWWEGLDWPECPGPPPEKTGLLVIGAGYTGLSAAIAAHDAGARVAVIDAGQPGQGASTRNGGMLGAHPRLGWERLAMEFGAETADAIFAEAAPALVWVKNLIAREAIDCDLQETGRIQLAYTPSHLAAQRKLAERVREKSSVACEIVEADGLGAEIATPLYHGGLLFPQHAALHPAKYHFGLLQAVLGRGIPVVAKCAALGTRREGARYVTETQRGAITTDKVVMATNGYTTRAFPWFARRVFPVPSYLIATEPLSPDLLSSLAPARRMMVETRARHSYFRLSPDGSRILFGGRAAIVNVDLRTAAARLHGTMTEIWPDLRDTRLTHVWTGNTGYSFGHMPQVGEHDGVHFAMGFSGSGTVLAPYLGAKAGLRAVGAAGGETAYDRTRLRPRWFHRGGEPHFLKPAELWYRAWVDRRENRAAGR